MRISAFWSGLATKTNGPFWPLWIATVGIITVFGRTERSISTSTYIPGQSSNFSLANFALAAMVPDEESTRLSMKSSSPVASASLAPGVKTRTTAGGLVM